jgi:predicted amidohydrolase YtcJ
MYTLNGAYLTFEEDIKGSIEPGKLADMVVIDRDIMTCPEDDIKDTVVLTTYLGGKVVYEA